MTSAEWCDGLGGDISGRYSNGGSDRCGAIPPKDLTNGRSANRKIRSDKPNPSVALPARSRHGRVINYEKVSAITCCRTGSGEVGTESGQGSFSCRFHFAEC